MSKPGKKVEELRDPINWARISQSISKGDGEGFSKYYENYFELMFFEAKRATGADESSCLDIVQNAMLKAIKGMKPVRDGDHLTAWTRVVVRNASYDWLRAQARRNEQLTSEADSEMSSNEESNAAVNAQARFLWIEQQLQESDPELRKMISLRYRLGWTLKDVAAKFGMKTGAVDGRIRRAIEKLRKQAELEFNE